MNADPDRTRRLKLAANALALTRPGFAQACSHLRMVLRLDPDDLAAALQLEALESLLAHATGEPPTTRRARSGSGSTGRSSRSTVPWLGRGASSRDGTSSGPRTRYSIPSLRARFHIRFRAERTQDESTRSLAQRLRETGRACSPRHTCAQPSGPCKA